MAKVYVSSTVADLEHERKTVFEWLVAAGHQPVHSYRPDSETVRESCLKDIDGCDLYVLILGHRYGWQPDGDSGGHLSITHLEFHRAAEKRIPRVALLRTSIPDVALSDWSRPDRAELVRRFESEVRAALRPSEFHDAEGLIRGLSTGVQHELEKLGGAAADDRRVIDIVKVLTDQLSDKDRQISELKEQLGAAVRRTLVAAEQPGASEAAAAARDLQRGDTRLAEALLRREEHEEARQIGTPGADEAAQRSQAAALAREQGALAMRHNVRAALAAFERAAQYEPEDPATHIFIGEMNRSMGDLTAALESFERAGEMAKKLAAREPENSEWRRQISLSHEQIGEALAVRGDLKRALNVYGASLAIAETLALQDAGNAKWQRDLSKIRTRIGDALVQNEDLKGAFEEYRRAFDVASALAARDPEDPAAQSELVVSQIKVGDVLIAQSNLMGALEEYRKSLVIVERLSAQDPDDAQLRRTLSISYNKIGDVLAARQDLEGALEEYRKSLAMFVTLAERDPANTEWQRDVAVAQDRVGALLLKNNEPASALATHRKSHDIYKKLAVRDPSNAQWQTDLAGSCGTLGAIAHEQSPEARREYLLRGYAILEELSRQGRLTPEQDFRPWLDFQLAGLGYSYDTAGY